MRRAMQVRHIVIAIQAFIIAYMYTRSCPHVSCPGQVCPGCPPVSCPPCAAAADISFDEKDKEQFYIVANRHVTDKIAGPEELKNGHFKREAKNEKCRVQPSHFYHTMYQQKLSKLREGGKPFQFLEIGYYNGGGFDAFAEFLPMAEAHSMEISCLPLQEGIDKYTEGSGVWPKKWGNFAAKNKGYRALRDANRLHCGDASSFDFINTVWTQHMHRADAPPLMMVIDDGSHLSEHMVDTVFYWFPRLAPGGILVMEDIEPFNAPETFRVHFMRKIMQDVHYCGNDAEVREIEHFPTIRPLLQSVHCEMHICVFERNDQPAQPNLSEELSRPPSHALTKEDI